MKNVWKNGMLALLLSTSLPIAEVRAQSVFETLFGWWNNNETPTTTTAPTQGTAPVVLDPNAGSRSASQSQPQSSWAA
jgi:hypothetical protein